MALRQDDDAQARAEIAKKLDDAEASRELAQTQLATVPGCVDPSTKHLLSAEVTEAHEVGQRQADSILW